jgi:WD40 repeat protein
MATSALLLLAVAIGAPIAAFKINQARLQARADAHLARERLYASDMQHASLAVSEGAFNHARELLTNHIPRRGEVDLRGFEWRHLAKIVKESEPLLFLQGLPAPSHWQLTTLTADGDILYNQSGEEICAWNMLTWTPVPIIPPPLQPPARWQWDPDRSWAYAIDPARFTLAAYTLPSFEPIFTIQAPGPISNGALNRDRHLLAASFKENGRDRVSVWNLSTKVEKLLPMEFRAEVCELEFSDDGALLAISTADGVISLWDVSNSQSIPGAKMEEEADTYIQFAPGSHRLLYWNKPTWKLGLWDPATGAASLEAKGDGRAVRFFSGNECIIVSAPDAAEWWDLKSKRRLGGFRGHGSATFGAAALSPDEKWLATASTDQTARIIEIATSTEVAILGGFGERITDAEFTPDGENIALLGGFGKLRVHRLSDVLQGTLFAKTPKEGIIDIALSPDGQHLAAISPEGAVTLWNKQTRRSIKSLSFPRYTIDSYPRVVFLPDGSHLAWVTGDALRFLDIKSDNIREIPIKGNREANAITCSPDGRELAFGCSKELMIWNIATSEMKPFIPTRDEIFAVKYSPDGAYIAIGDREGTLALTDRASQRVLFRSNYVHQPGLYGLDFSPDGRLLATCGSDSTIRLWQVKSGKLQLTRTLRGHRGYVSTLEFSPDGTRLATPSADETVKIWDPHSGAELATLHGHRGLVAATRFSRDGRTMYSAGLDGEIHVWHAPPLLDIDPLSADTSIKAGPAPSK